MLLPKTHLLAPAPARLAPGILDRAGDLPLRRYRLCRQALWSGTTQAVVLGALAVSLTLFARSFLTLFASHGSGGNPWHPRIVLGLMAVVILITLRRLLNRLRELRALRAELAALKAQVQGDPDAPGGLIRPPKCLFLAPSLLIREGLNRARHGGCACPTRKMSTCFSTPSWRSPA